MSGFIKIHRSIMEWEWYDDTKTFVLFLHILLKANYKEKKWRGKTIKRGQLWTSLDSLSEETQLSKQQIRTILNKLKSTGEITDQSTHEGRMVTVLNYDKYQNVTDELTHNQQTDNTQTNTQATDDQQTSNRPPTDLQHQHKNVKNDKKGKNDKEREEVKKVIKRFTPPTLDQVAEYMTERNLEAYRIKTESEKYFDYYSANGWKAGRNPMKDWKASVRNWLSNNYSQPKQSGMSFGRSAEDEQKLAEWGFSDSPVLGGRVIDHE